MGLGPPSCDECRVWLRLSRSKGWLCPICEKDSKKGYTHLSHKNVIDNNIIPLLKFLKGKNPNGID